MAFVSSGHHAFHDAGDAYLDLGAPTQHHHYPASSVPDSSTSAYYNPNVPMACDIKPRLTKEQHDILEAHYQKQNKPNTSTKKGFAESLNVSLDKVNNWFQNRRAKAKQDAKKHAGSFNLYTQQPGSSLNFSSDSDASPSFAPNDYFNMMQQCGSDEQLANEMSTGQMQHQFQEQTSQYPNGTTSSEQYHNVIPQHLSADLFDTPQELNRRTLTQEQFDEFAQHSGIMDSSGQFEQLQNGFPGDADVLQQVFPEMHQADFKQQDVFAFQTSMPASLPSNDSSLPSTISEQSMFPSSTAMQEHGSISSASSEWADSRSSSVSITPSQDAFYSQNRPSTQHTTATTSQWQPGQSVPVDPNELHREFLEAAQRSGQPQQQQQQQQQTTHHEQPLAWPADEAFIRRESASSNMLTQQMSTFGIQTPQSQQSATFKTPAPPGEGSSSIAARRQRPRPAALGLASLRSQSYSGSAQPGSPGQQAHNLAPGQQLRRIRSSNVINGGVAPGRVMKSVPGSAQRSPLSWTFSDAMSSPKVARHASSGSINSLAPPTPMSPGEQQRSQFPPWQSSSSGHFSRQASISETDAEHDLPTMPPTTGHTSQNVSSPPSTPMYHHHHHFQHPQHFNKARIGSNAITENTPPQSAPAAQQTFPADVFMLPQQQMQPFLPAHHQQQFMNVSVPEQHFHVPAVTYAPVQHFGSMPDQQSQASMQFPHGLPIVNAQGNLEMAYPSQVQQMQFVQHLPPQTQPQPLPQQHMQPSQGSQYNFVTTAGPTTGMQVTAQLPKQQSQPATEFFVHEYSPPQEIKRSATQRKVPVDSGPKNYTFANQGPEHFEKGKEKRGQDHKSSTASSSPSSANSSC